MEGIKERVIDAIRKGTEKGCGSSDGSEPKPSKERRVRERRGEDRRKS